MKGQSLFSGEKVGKYHQFVVCLSSSMVKSCTHIHTYMYLYEPFIPTKNY